MNKIIITLAGICFMLSCSSSKNFRHSRKDSEESYFHKLKDDNTFFIQQYSDDPNYAYSPEKPVKVGGITEGPKNERRFLNALCGPNGEPIKYIRQGSCCHFKSDKALFGDMAPLDIYEIQYTGLKQKKFIYINMYDSDTLMVPVGLKLR